MAGRRTALELNRSPVLPAGFFAVLPLDCCLIDVWLGGPNQSGPTMPRTRPQRDAFRSQRAGKRQLAAIHDSLIQLPLERRRHATICAKSATRITVRFEEPQGA